MGDAGQSSFDSWGNKQFGTPTGNSIQDFTRGVGGGLGLFYDAAKGIVVDGWDCVSSQNGPISGTCGSTAINLATLDYGAFVKNTGKEVSLQVGKDIAEQETKSLAEQFAKECIVGQKDDKDTNSRLALLFGGVEVEAADLCEITLVNDRMPINSKYAGSTHPSGVPFKSTGFPDFSLFATQTTKIENLTGNYLTDAALANKAVGLSQTPSGFVWHHVEDGVTMQLIPQDIHNAARHTGGSAVIKSNP